MEGSLQAILIDDEQHCLDTLLWQLEKYVPQVALLGSFTSPVEALSFVKQNAVDLVFLDIEMPEMNGFEFLKSVGSVPFDVIFTTAYDEFALDAFKASAIDYLLKPIDKEDLGKAVGKVIDKNKASMLPEQMEILFQALNQSKPIKDRIAVSASDGLHFVKIAEILYCTSDSNYTFIHLDSTKKILVSRTLKEIEAMLAGQGFLRIHHSHLINLSKIERYIRGDGGYVIMDDKKSLSVSRSRKEALLAHFSS